MTDRPRVLHLGKYYAPVKGGIETYVQSLSVRMKDYFDLQVVVANLDRTTLNETVDGVQVMRCGTLCKLSSAPICTGMIDAIRRFRPDLLHIHLPNPGAVMAYLLSGHVCPVVVSYHSDVVRQTVLNWGFVPILKRLLDRSAAIVTASPGYVETSPVLRGYRDRCRVIPYGISPTAFENTDPRTVSGIRERYGSRIVLGVGRLVYYKGFDYLIRAMQGVQGTLLIIGEGPLHGPLTQLIRQMNLQDRVHLLGGIEDAAPYYHAADVFCLPSIARSEAFGIVQLEAMACGKPVVNTALKSGVPFVSVNRVTGLTVPPADAGALTGALNHLLDNEAERLSYGEAARQRLHRHFTVDIMTRQVFELYREIISHPAASSLPAFVALEHALPSGFRLAQSNPGD